MEFIKIKKNFSISFQFFEIEFAWQKDVLHYVNKQRFNLNFIPTFFTISQKPSYKY